MAPAQALKNQVALVAGATRGAGRGIARALAERRAPLVVLHRPQRRRPSLALRATRDHRRDRRADCSRRRTRHPGALRSHRRSPGRSARGPHPEGTGPAGRAGQQHRRRGAADHAVRLPFWDVDLTHADLILRQSLVSHVVTARGHVAPEIIRRKRGLILEVTEGDVRGGGGESPGVVGQAGHERAGAQHGR